MSAAARAIFQRQQQQQEEEARFRRIQEEQERKIREEEERLEAERRAIEEEKERKRKIKADKIEAQKAAGTYLTKAEKEKQKKLAMKLEAMKMAGLVSTSTGSSQSTGEATSTKIVYSKKKPSRGGVKEIEELPSILEPKLDETNIAKVVNDGDESSGDEIDDWEAADFSVVAAKIGEIARADIEVVEGADEDILEVEKRLEQEKLRQLGIERIKREEEARIKRLVTLYSTYNTSFIYVVYFILVRKKTDFKLRWKRLNVKL